MATTVSERPIVGAVETHLEDFITVRLPNGVRFQVHRKYIKNGPQGLSIDKDADIFHILPLGERQQEEKIAVPWKLFNRVRAKVKRPQR